MMMLYGERTRHGPRVVVFDLSSRYALRDCALKGDGRGLCPQLLQRQISWERVLHLLHPICELLAVYITKDSVILTTKQ